MNEIFYFDENVSVMDLPLEMLRQSLMLRDVKGDPPKNRPIQSWEFIDVIMAVCKQQGLNAKVEHIYVPKNGAHPIINEAEKELYKSGTNIPISKWLFNKVAFLITIKHPSDDDETITALAVSYHQQGIQVAFGQHVHLCGNMCIFGGNTMYTFGEKRMPFDKLFEVLTSWLLNFEQKRAEDIAVIRRMKETNLGPVEIDTFLNAMIGKMYRRAIRTAYMKAKDSIFDTVQCSRFVQNMEEHLRTYRNEAGDYYVPLSAWELYNWGTEILKPDNTDIATLYLIIAEWGTFLSEELAFLVPKTREEDEDE